jgi:hypothetical protein
MLSGWLHHQLETNSKDENKENREKNIYTKKLEKKEEKDRRKKKKRWPLLCVSFFLINKLISKLGCCFAQRKERDWPCPR